MKVTDSLITFDGDVFLNRSSILKLGLPEDDADAIYNDLFGQSFVSDGATAYIFLDTNLRIRNNRSLFIKHSIIEKTKYSFSDFIDSLKSFFGYYTNNYVYAKFKFTGFFKITQPYKYGSLTFSNIYASDHAYINKRKVANKTCCLMNVGEISIDKKTRVVLPRGLDNPDANLENRIHSELYFNEVDVTNAIYAQLGDFDLSTLSLPDGTIFIKY